MEELLTLSPAWATGGDAEGLCWVWPNSNGGAAPGRGLFCAGERPPRKWDPEVASPLGSHQQCSRSHSAYLQEAERG